MREAIFFHPLPCCSRPCRNSRCASAVHRPVFSPWVVAGVAVWVVAIVTVAFFFLDCLEDVVVDVVVVEGGSGCCDCFMFGSGCATGG